MEHILDDQKQIKGEKRKVILIIAGLVFLALLAIAFGGYQYKKGNISVVAGCLPGDRFSSTSGEPCFEGASIVCAEGEFYNLRTGEPCVGAEDPNATPATGAKDYQKTIDTYANQRILFNADCVADPATLELPPGGEILLANHSKKVIEVGVQKRTAILPPYRYVLSDPLLIAQEVPITCNGEVRATVIIK